MNKVPMTISIYQSTRDWLKRLEHERDINISRFIERLLLQAKEAHEVQEDV